MGIHEAVGMANEAEALSGMAQKVKEVLSVQVVLEYPLRPVLPGRHMVEDTGVFDPQRTSHERNYQGTCMIAGPPQRGSLRVSLPLPVPRPRS